MYKLFLALFALMVLGCKEENSLAPAQDAEEAGTRFIRASLDGDYAKARFYLLKDSTNLFLMKQQQSNYDHMAANEKRGFRESSIRPIQILNQNDSVTLYRYYYTANPTDTTTLRITKVNDEWLVDLKSFFDQKSRDK